MKNKKTTALICALAFLITGGLIWYIRGVAIPAEEAANRELARQIEAEKAAEEEPKEEYEYKVEPIEPKENSGVAGGRDTGSVTVTVDENGDEWVTRDWTKETGGDTKSETKPENGGANIASGGGEVKTDSDGVYHGEPEAPKQETPKQEQKPSGGGSPKDGDRKVENGVTYEYVDWYGWVEVGEGSHGEQNEPSGGDYNKVVENARM